MARLQPQTKRFLILSIALAVIIAFFIFAKSINPNALETAGAILPLPLFTLIIALIDGFNPCNLFVLIMLLSLMITESHSRKRIFAVGFTFIGVIYLFYVLVMVLFMNILKLIGLIGPLLIIVAVIAIIVGLINMKELFFYRKGVTLMIQDRYLKPLRRRIDNLAHKMKNASMPALITSAVLLAVFASLIELPCTAGFPIVYTGVLASHVLASSAGYYLYLLLYGLIYVLPLVILILLLGYALKGRTISKDTMAIIKFIGGAIMLLLGILLLVAPSLIGL